MGAQARDDALNEERMRDSVRDWLAKEGAIHTEVGSRIHSACEQLTAAGELARTVGDGPRVRKYATYVKASEE